MHDRQRALVVSSHPHRRRRHRQVLDQAGQPYSLLRGGRRRDILRLGRGVIDRRLALASSADGCTVEGEHVARSGPPRVQVSGVVSVTIPDHRRGASVRKA